MCCWGRLLRWVVGAGGLLGLVVEVGCGGRLLRWVVGAGC